MTPPTDAKTGAVGSARALSGGGSGSGGGLLLSEQASLLLAAEALLAVTGSGILRCTHGEGGRLLDLARVVQREAARTSVGAKPRVESEAHERGVTRGPRTGRQGRRETTYIA